MDSVQTSGQLTSCWIKSLDVLFPSDELRLNFVVRLVDKDYSDDSDQSKWQVDY